MYDETVKKVVGHHCLVKQNKKTVVIMNSYMLMYHPKSRIE